MSYTLLSKYYYPTTMDFPYYSVHSHDKSLKEINDRIEDETIIFFKKKKAIHTTFLVIEFEEQGNSLNDYEKVILANKCFEFVLRWSTHSNFISTYGNNSLIKKTIYSIRIMKKIMNLDNYKKKFTDKKRTIDIVNSIKNPFNDPLKNNIYDKLKYIVTYTDDEEHTDCVLEPLIC